jgi:hypothetical protein
MARERQSIKLVTVQVRLMLSYLNINLFILGLYIQERKA